MEDYRYTTTQIQRQQSCYFAQLFPSITSVSTGAVADWCEELTQQISDHSSSSTGNLAAKVNTESASTVAPTAVSISTNSPLINVPAQGKLLQQHRERLENLPEDIRVSEASDDAGFKERFLLDNFSLTSHDIELTGFGCAGSCREHTTLRDDDRSKPKGWIRGEGKDWPSFGSQSYEFPETLWN